MPRPKKVTRTPNKTTKRKPAPKKTATAAKRAAAKKHGTRADLGKPIDAFFAKQPAALRPIAEELRRLIEATVPEATSSIKWGMPFYELEDKMLCAIGGHKSHVNLIVTGEPDAFDDPEGRLAGESKLGRHAKLKTLADIDGDAIRGWIRTSIDQLRGKA